MSSWATARAWVASKVDKRSEISSISATPAARARAITSSRSASNWGACRLTWLSISMSGGPQPGDLVDRRGEHLGPVEVQAGGPVRGLGQAAPQGGPAGALDPAGGQRPVAHRRQKPVEQQLEPFGALRPAEGVGQGQSFRRRGRVVAQQGGEIGRA